MFPKPQRQYNHRLTISVDDEFLASLKIFMKARGHANVSEAIRDMARGLFMETEIAIAEDENCMAALAYSYDFNTRKLGSVLNRLYASSCLPVLMLRTQADPKTCIEVGLLRGRRTDIERFGKEVSGERGVRYSQLTLFAKSNQN
jgi:CopG family nickel-responsive transcriptional regulator